MIHQYDTNKAARAQEEEFTIPLCVLLELCRHFMMEDECQDIMNSRNRTSFTDNYDRPKEAIVGMLSVFSLLGTVGNALVLYVYVRKKNKLASTIFIICLAATDFMTSCVIMPFTMTMESLDYFVFYDVVCKTYFFLITCNVPFAAFIMVAIAVDRYLCICRPHCHLLDSRRSQIGIIFLALISAGFGIMTSLFHGVYMTETFRVDPSNDTQMRMLRDSLVHQMKLGNFSETCANNTDPFCVEEARNSTYAYLDVMSHNMVTVCQNHLAVVYTGQCQTNEALFNIAFRKVYQRVYASMFLICFLVVFLLYISIYRSVLVRRKQRLRAKQKTNLRLLRDVSVTDTHQTTAETPLQNGFEMSEMTGEKRKAMLESADNSLKEKYLLANIRTAVMLFVVTLAFILAFLPSWLMAHNVMRFHAVVFYFYFAYNVSNPIIYAFMNPTFRKELQEVVCCCRGFCNRTLFSK